MEVQVKKGLSEQAAAQLKTVLFCLIMLPVFAAESQAANGLLQAGLHSGGDDLITARTTAGDTEKIKGGGFVSLSVGIGFDVTEILETRLMAGLKLDTIKGDNGEATFSRYPLEALLMYKLSNNAFIGGGLSYHVNPEIERTGIFTNQSSRFDNALGVVAGFDYVFSSQIYVGLKLTNINYRIDNQTFNGNSIGVIFGIRL